MPKQKKIQKIKSSVFQRGFALASLSLKTSAHLASHGLSTLLASNKTKNEKWNLFLINRALDFSSELGELKGSLMKAGQMLSMYGEHFLPEEANQILKTLQSKSPVVEWSAVEPILVKNLGSEKLSLLKITPEAIGSASLGQAHLAEIISTGEKIVLKVQYPGVDRAIDSDLKAIRTFLNLLQVLPKGVSTEALFSEVRDMLLQEVNYELEATATESYRERLFGDDRFVVPKVYREFCGPQVLATSYEPGFSPDDPVVKSLSQERRNQLSLNFLDLYYQEIFNWGTVQTDPHLGNYKIRVSSSGHDQLVLLDFGAVRNYSKSFLKNYHQLIWAALEQDRTTLVAAAEALDFLKLDDDPSLIRAFEDFCLMTVEPFLDASDSRRNEKMDDQGVYDWKNSNLPNRLTQKGFAMVQSFQLRPPPREILFLERKTGGVFIFLSVLGAKINGRPTLLKYFNQK